jgi:hypothetical protein
MIVSFKDPVTKLLHIVESSDISQLDDKTLKVFVDHHNMFVTLEFADKSSLEIAIDGIYKCEKLNAYSDSIEATISFPEENKQNQPEVDIEMYGIDISSLFSEDNDFDEEFITRFLLDSEEDYEEDTDNDDIN